MDILKDILRIHFPVVSPPSLDPRPLDLGALVQGLAPGLTPERGAAMAQAARVCLTESRHPSPCGLTVDGGHSGRLPLVFDQASEAESRSWNDQEEATQQGAYAVAILVMKHLDNLTVLERSRRGTHFDWWLGPADGAPLFQEKVHLEVSGIRDGSDARISERIVEKWGRFGPEPAVDSFRRRVVVVEYSRPLVRTKVP